MSTEWLDLCGDARGRDCWGLVAEVYRRRGVDLVGLSAESFDKWREVATPEPGDVLWTRRATGDPHVGIVLDAERYLHSAQGLVAVGRTRALTRAGLPVRYYRHDGAEAVSVAPDPVAGFVRVVYIPDPLGRPTERATWFRAPGTLGALSPEGANVVLCPEGPRHLRDVANRPAPPVAVYATAPGGTEVVLAAIGLALSVISAGLSLLLAPGTPSERADDPSPTFDLGGLRNTAADGLVQPVVYGEHRAAGNFISTVQRIDANGRAVLYALVLLSRGPVQSVGGLTADVDELAGPAIPSSIQIDGNPASGYDCRVSVRLGGYGQTPIGGFDEAATAVPYSAQLLQSVPFGHTTTQAVTGFDVLVTYPSGLVEYDDDPPNAPFAISVVFTVRWRVKGSTTWTSETWTHTNGVGGQFNVQFSRRNLTRDLYEVQIERLTAASPFARQQSDSYILAVNEVAATGVTYAGCALLGVRLVGSDQIAGGIPVLSALVEGRKVWVWDGVSTTAPAFGAAEVYSDNPAWCALDIALNRDYGLGRGGRLTLDEIDLASFADWADYCDELVDDGRGGTFKRARLGLVIDAPQSGYELLQSIASASWAKLYWSGNKLRASVEGPASPSFVFSRGNVRDVQVTYLGRRQRPNAVEVSYLNSEVNYDSDIATRYDETAILTNGEAVSKEDVQAVGVTRPGQAARLAQSRMLKHRLVRRTFALAGGPETAHLIPGDVTHLGADALGVGAGGRVLASASGTVTLDADLVVTARVRLDVWDQDDTGETRYIDTGTYSRGVAITVRDSGGVPSAWASPPAAGSKWVIGSTSSAAAGVLVRLDEATTGPDLTRAFRATEYVAAVYSDDPGDVETFTDALPNARGMPASVSYLRGVPHVVQSTDGTILDAVRLTWQQGADWESAEVWTRYAGPGAATGPGSWRFAAWARGEAVIATGTGTHEFAVAAKSPAGTRQRVEQAARTTCHVLGYREPPEAPAGLSVAVVGGLLTVTATPPVGAAVKGYEVRYGTTWGGSVRLAECVPLPWSAPCPFVGSETIRVRCVSRAGIRSATEATATATHMLAESVYTTDVSSNEHTGWTGTKTDTAVTGSELQLSGSALSGTYVTADKSTAVTKEAQVIYIRARCDLADVAMTWEEAGFIWTDPYYASATWATTYLNGFEAEAAWRSRVWEDAGFTWGGLLASLLTWGGPTDVQAALTPLIEYDVNTGSGFSGSWTEYRGPVTVANLTGVRVRVTLRRPHTRYDPRLVELTTTTALVGESEPVRFCGEFNQTNATGAGTTIRGFIASTNANNIVTVPTGKKAVFLGVTGTAETGATAGTYRVDFGIYNQTDTSFVSFVQAGGTANSLVSATAQGTRTAPLGTLAAGKTFLAAYQNHSSSPGALANDLHHVKISWIFEDV